MRKEVISNPRYPHTIKIVRIQERIVPVENTSEIKDEDPFASNDTSSPQTKTERKEVILYEGCGRSFTDTTTNGMGNVDINKRKASIPVRYDKWEADKQPLDGDIIYATVGNNTEKGRVRDSEPDNERTIVYWELVRV
ncbi:hypothetical protein [Prevotella melaninogenica]|uniref:hypothetical protein n=1 Tax=Prevotella melaninogenica TaxID=28132 RepID=UPI001BA49BB4|nr:hypothetical protein [Prevotella melaninogenica]QUB66087.1 hypothetical protein J5A57_03040 [Prevotella melaninogenica]